MTYYSDYRTRVAYRQNNYSTTMAPRIAKGKVIGVAGGEFPTRGCFEAHDAKAGRLAWRFYTVPGDPAKPFENEDMELGTEACSARRLDKATDRL
jgi:quinohemoprotein ethanol dehydrogenase